MMKVNIYQTINRFRPVPVIIAVLFAGIFIFSTLHAETEEKDSGPAKQRPDVMFLDRYHDQHMEAASCLDCHHVYENGKNILEQDSLESGDAETSCSSCHNKEAKLDTTKAFHLQCVGCHDRMRNEKKKTGPCLCGECHIRGKE